MQITHIKFKNHPILSNLELNFCDDQGIPYDTIVLAGENGCGKTTILKFISNLFKNISSFLSRNLDYDFSIDFYLSEQEQKDIKDILHRDGVQVNNTELSNLINITYNHSFDKINDKLSSTFPSPFRFNIIAVHIYKCLYSVCLDTDVNFQTENIKSIGATELDRDLDKIRNTHPKIIANDLKQLLVDIASQDNEDLGTWVDEHPNMVPPADIKKQRISRFTDAFNSVFDDIKFDRIKTFNEAKQVVFNKKGKEISIDELSSGEKQIVFRGGYILRDMVSIKGEVVLIDEPEISMHPKWQNKILNFYKKLITDETGKQTSQMFVATHSEHVIKNAYKSNDLILVLSNSDTGITATPIKNLRTFNFSPTYSEIKYFAFNIPSTEFHDELYGYIKEKNNLSQEINVENFFVEHGIQKTKKWARMQNGIFGNAAPVTLMTYIRNVIHHPEAANANNNPLGKCSFTDTELEQSIQQMLQYI